MPAHTEADNEGGSSSVLTPPVTIDGTGLTTTIPITVKNAKAESGVELWYTGTVATAYALMNASGVIKGGVGIAAAANDWITGSAADDIVIFVGATKVIRLGAKGAAAAAVIIEGATGNVGIGAAPAAGLPLEIRRAGDARFLINSTDSNTSGFLFQLGGTSQVGLTAISGLILADFLSETRIRDSTSSDALITLFPAAASRKLQLSLDVLSHLNSRVSTQFDKTDTTLANVTGLTANVLAGASYEFEATLFVDANVTGGSKYAIAGTATATAVIYEVTLVDDTSNANTIVDRQTALGGASGQAGTTAGLAKLRGLITVNAAGTLTVQFAQNAASGTSSVLVGSTFKLQRIA